MRTVVWDGKTIKHPGVYAGVSLEAYHSQTILDGPSVSSSQLRRVLEINGGSPAHMYCEWSGNPDCAESKDSRSLILGRAAHHALLGQEEFSAEFVIRPDRVPDKHGILTAWPKAGGSDATRDWLAKAASGGFRWIEDRSKWVPDPEQRPLTVLTDKDIDAIQGMAISLGNHPVVRQGILRGQVERSFFWKDKRTGLWLKARPDNVPSDSGDFCDLKTTTSVQWPDLIRTISDYAYHQQAALIVEGATACAALTKSNFKFNSFSFAFVETKPPYCSRIAELKPVHIELGQRQNRHALDLIARCIETKSWPGPGAFDVHMIDLSERYRTEAEIQLTETQQEAG